jgi:hypothetical protein
LRSHVVVLAVSVMLLSGCNGRLPRVAGVANTANAAYLPLLSGNTWTFASGTAILDAGAVTLSCSCPQNGKTFEEHDISVSGVYGGSWIIGKGQWPAGSLAGHTVTYLVGDSTDRGLTIALMPESTDGTVPGFPLLDDAPAAGETFTLTSGGSSATTAIASVGGTQNYGNGQIIDDIARVVVTGGGLSSPIMALSAAKGVGYTSVPGPSGGMTTLVSFSIDAARSQASRRASLAAAAFSRADLLKPFRAQ